MYKRMCVRDCRYVTRLAIAAVILVVCSLVNAQTAAFAPARNVAVAGPDRPADVPEGYVITPFGYFHPSCVMELAEGNTLLDKTVRHADGTAEAAPVCNYAHYTASGAVVFPDSRAASKTGAALTHHCPPDTGCGTARGEPARGSRARPAPCQPRNNRSAAPPAQTTPARAPPDRNAPTPASTTATASGDA